MHIIMIFTTTVSDNGKNESIAVHFTSVFVIFPRCNSHAHTQMADIQRLFTIKQSIATMRDESIDESYTPQTRTHKSTKSAIYIYTSIHIDMYIYIYTCCIHINSH